MKIEEIKLIVSKQIQVGKNEIKSNLRAHGKVVSGRTLRSLRSEITNTPTTVTGRIWSTVSYFPAMERGRGPFKGGAERGLSERLYSWSKLKGISFQTDTQRWAFAYALARKINKEGTRLFKQGGRQDIYTPVVSSIKKNILAALNKSSVLNAADVVKFEHIDLKMTI